MPVFNEKDTVLQVIEAVQNAPLEMEREIIVVDDGSTDGTRDLLESLDDSNIKRVYHSHNQGKGAAVATGVRHAEGDIVIIQDADLEYSPSDYPVVLEPIVSGKADVVYGTRFLGSHRVFMFWHYMANRFLTFVTNLLYNTMLTDMETCYKAFRIDVIRSFDLKSRSFDLEPELTAKVFKGKFKTFEVPISYNGRSYAEGKKITWRDAVVALWTLIKFRFVD
ncbi:MAG: glycosyltransferase family 2 protein [Candidatus Eisenbacteria sp.]|nr:glycosyltransferase family 2 protein [Candidatus Eisenbacteria bacterium]